jgi:hypothetical protein
LKSDGLQFLAGLEGTALPGGILTLAGTRIAADACLAGFDSENAETAELMRWPRPRRFQGFENGFDRVFGLGACDAGAATTALTMSA